MTFFRKCGGAEVIDANGRLGRPLVQSFFISANLRQVAAPKFTLLHFYVKTKGETWNAGAKWGKIGDLKRAYRDEIDGNKTQLGKVTLL